MPKRVSSSLSARWAAPASVWSVSVVNGRIFCPHRVDGPVVGEPGQCRHALHADVGLAAVQRLQDALGGGGVADLAERAHHGRHRFRVRLQHLDQPRHRLAVSHGPERVDRALADPPILVLGRLDQVVQGALVARLVQDLDRGASHLLVLVRDEFERRADDLRASDLAERVRGAAAHPPVGVADGLQQELDRAFVADDVQHLDRRAARTLGLVLQHLDQVADGLRVLAAAQQFDRGILDIDVRVAQQRRDHRRIHLAAAVGDGAQRRRPHQLVRVLEGPLQRGAHLGSVEPGEQGDDVRARDGVLAVDPRDQFVHAVRVHELACDPEQGGFLVRVLVIGGVQDLAQVEAVLLRCDDVEHRRLGDGRVLQELEQQPGRVVARRGERPCDAGDRARVLLRKRLGKQRKRPVVDERCQHFDECDRFTLVRGRERIDDRLDGVLAEALEPGQRSLCLRAGRVATLPYLGDEAIRPIASEDSHPTPAFIAG